MLYSDVSGFGTSAALIRGSLVGNVDVTLDHRLLQALVVVDLWLLQVAIDKLQHAYVVFAEVARVDLENLGHD